jgi:hypothetical protein
MHNDIERVEKESIPGLKFTKAAKKPSEELIRKLHQAEKLGNAFKGKVTIRFETEQGTKETETTIWNLMDEHIQLKAGVTIPLSAIVDLKI